MKFLLYYGMPKMAWVSKFFTGLHKVFGRSMLGITFDRNKCLVFFFNFN